MRLASDQVWSMPIILSALTGVLVILVAGGTIIVERIVGAAAFTDQKWRPLWPTTNLVSNRAAIRAPPARGGYFSLAGGLARFSAPYPSHRHAKQLPDPERETELAGEIDNWDEAQGAYERKIRLNPGHYAAYLLVAWSHRRRSEPEQAQ
jgi:hypothetical protein